MSTKWGNTLHGFSTQGPLSSKAWLLIHSVSARATGTDNGYLQASRSKQVPDELLITQSCITALKKELKVNDLTELTKQNLISNETGFWFF